MFGEINKKNESVSLPCDYQMKIKEDDCDFNDLESLFTLDENNFLGVNQVDEIIFIEKSEIEKKNELKKF